MKKILFSIMTLLIAATICWPTYRIHLSLASQPHYVGQKPCSQCHQSKSTIHNNSLHHLAFRPVTLADQVVGNFEQNNPLVTFDKAEITHVIGNKWEQVYIHRVDGEYYPFPAKWMISTKKWVAYKVHDWQQTPASTQCNGCHTTGYSAATLTFSEYGVQCEACHGPASQHVSHQTMVQDTLCLACHNKDQKVGSHIIVSQKSSVCGQCHSRGTTITTNSAGEVTVFNFPIEYLPNDELSASFVQTSPQTGSNSKNWWGNGVAKNRHQEFADFSLSNHAKSLIHLRNRPSPHGTKTDKPCLQCHSQDYRSAPEDQKPTRESALLGITCVSCHKRHTDSDLTNVCNECHQNDTPSFSDQHIPCRNITVRCIDCHMPYIIKTGGTYAIRSHAFKIIPPVATTKYDMPNSCQNGSCHLNESVEWANEQFQLFYQR